MLFWGLIDFGGAWSVSSSMNSRSSSSFNLINMSNFGPTMMHASSTSQCVLQQLHRWDGLDGHRCLAGQWGRRRAAQSPKVFAQWRPIGANNVSWTKIMYRPPSCMLEDQGVCQESSFHSDPVPSSSEGMVRGSTRLFRFTSTFSNPSSMTSLPNWMPSSKPQSRVKENEGGGGL